MKRILAVILSGAMLLSLAACGTTAAAPAAAPAATAATEAAAPAAAAPAASGRMERPEGITERNQSLASMYSKHFWISAMYSAVTSS